MKKDLAEALQDVKGEEMDAEQEIEHESEIQSRGRNTTVQCLILRGNNIGSVGAHGFAEVMRTHPSLTALALRASCLCDTGAAAVAFTCVDQAFRRGIL